MCDGGYIPTECRICGDEVPWYAMRAHLSIDHSIKEVG
jgi:hypothetical protein